MSNYSSLKATINANIKTNGNQEITGSVLNSVLNAIVDSVGIGYQYLGIATPSTNPGSPDQKVFYIADQAGTYTNFGGIVVADGEFVILRFDSSWHKDVTGAASSAQLADVDERLNDLIANLSETAYVDVTHVYDGSYPGKGISSAGMIFSLSSRIVYYKLFAEETEILYDLRIASNSCIMYAMGGTPGNPTNKTMLVTSQGVGSFVVPAGARLYWSGYNPANSDYTTDGVTLQVESVGELKEFATRDEIDAAVDPIFAAENRERAIKLKADRYASVNVDWMQVSSGAAGMDNKDLLPVVSSSASYITLSAEDAAHFLVDGAAVVHYNDGTCKMVYLQAASGTSVHLIDPAQANLSGVNYVQNLHDTPRGGAGIHLSQLGYIMLAQFTAQEIASRLSQKDSNILASLMMFNSTESADKKSIIDSDGNVCATIETDFVVGGLTPNGNGLLQSYGIVEGDQINSWVFGFLYKAYRFQQGVKDKYIKFNLPANGEGFVEIECGLSPRKPATSTGTATIKVYADGVEVYSATTGKYYKRFQVTGVSARRQISVSFILNGNVDTELGIYSINFYAMSNIVPEIDLSGKKIAVLGDSWTQFPGLANALALYPDYNTIGTRPDGTTLDGLAYFPKELARITGAEVDNWGHSNMRADNWGLVKIDEILSFKQYDYLLIEFFTNDVNASIPVGEWARNIALIAEKCKMACVRPIIMLPCRNNGPTINPLGIYHETTLRGLGTF